MVIRGRGRSDVECCFLFPGNRRCTHMHVSTADQHAQQLSAAHKQQSSKRERERDPCTARGKEGSGGEGRDGDFWTTQARTGTETRLGPFLGGLCGDKHPALLQLVLLLLQLKAPRIKLIQLLRRHLALLAPEEVSAAR